VCPSGSYCGAAAVDPTMCPPSLPLSNVASTAAEACQGYGMRRRVSGWSMSVEPTTLPWFCLLACEGLTRPELWCCDHCVLSVSSYVCSYATVVRTLAGGLNGTFAAFADGSGSQAGFNQPYGVAVDASGNTYVADSMNQRVRKVTPGGGATMLFLFVNRLQQFEACLHVARNDELV
jgi:hypothetical protein